MWRSLIVVENDLLIYREPISNTGSYARLTIVPKEFYNVLFVAFHTNPAGGHLNSYCTLHRLRLGYYWPGMYSYIKRMCSACPGCTLTDPTRGKSSKLVYNSSTEAPFKVLHVDAYSAGAHSGFEGSTSYLIGFCGMCSFGIVEPVTSANASPFASAIMKMQLRFDFCHTVVLDEDSKFFSVCRESLDLLKINCHVLSGDNHNPMLIKWLCRYFNKGLCIMTNKRNSVRVALESLLLLLYAWNSCPVPGTDISRSLVAVGRKFAFPIDFSTGMHQELTSSPTTVESYSRNLSKHLAACREIAMLLLFEHRAWHQALINSRRRDPRIYKPDDVFACCAVQSDASKGCVGKLEFSFTGPWQIISSADGGLYNIEYCHHPTQWIKKHTADLTPYPAELIPFEPINGPNTQYSQLLKAIDPHPFKEAGISGFLPPQPFKVPAMFLNVCNHTDFRWWTLSELNANVDKVLRSSNKKRRKYFEDDTPFFPDIMYTGPPP
jgi:hypothetical protein